MGGARPNIVQIVADDLGCGDLSYANGGLSSTPSLDALAAESVVFDQQYSASPVCAPARASLLTGRYPQRTGVIDTLEVRGLDRLDPGEITMADCLRSSGYATGLVGKWHTGAIGDRFHPRHRGFDEFVGFRGGWSDYWEWRLEAGRTSMRADGRYLTDVLSDEAVAFVHRHRSRPFYLHLAYTAPHFPWQASSELIERYRSAGHPTGIATVYAMVESMDEGIGRVLAAIEALGLADQTIVQFCSDNGPQLTGHPGIDLHRPACGLRGEKGDVFEGGVRVPGMLRWPDGLPRAQGTSLMMHFADWMPTLLAAAGVQPPAVVLDGRDRVAELRGDAPVDDRPRFWQWTRYRPDRRANVAMRDGNWKLVMPSSAARQAVLADDAERDEAHAEGRWAHAGIIPLVGDEVGDHPASSPLLFDLDTDPGERHDLAEIHPRRVAAMTLAIDEWWDDVHRRENT